MALCLPSSTYFPSSCVPTFLGNAPRAMSTFHTIATTKHLRRSTCTSYSSERHGGDNGGESAFPAEGGEIIQRDVLAVFQAAPARGTHYSMLDVRDAVETCTSARGAEREQCFLNFGLRADNVDKYYEPVMRLEESVLDLESPEDVLAQRMVRVGGFLLVLTLGYMRRGC